MIAKKWAEELESGKYLQAKRRLRTPEGYCCLGVLCEAVLNIEPEWSEEDECYSYEDNFILIDNPFGDGRETFLNIPPELQEKAGGEIRLPATCLNDYLNFSFAEIAQCIRFTFPEEFENETIW